MRVVGSFAGSWIGRGAAGVVLIALVGGVVVAQRLSTGSSKVEIRTAPAARGSVLQTVAVSGAVNPAAQVRLNFKSSGRLADVMVKVGDQVAASQALARLDTSDTEIALRQAQANLLSAQARYDQTLAGATAEDIAIAKQTVDNATRMLEETRRSTTNDLATSQQSFTKLKTAYTAAQNSFTILGTGVPTDVDTFKTGFDTARVILANAVTDLTSKSTVDITTAKNAIGQADSAMLNAQSVAANQLSSSLVEWTSARDHVVAAWLDFDGALQRGTDTSGATSNYQSAAAAYTLAAAKLLAALDSTSSPITSAQSSGTSAQSALSSSTSKTDPDLDRTRADLGGFQAALATQTQLSAAIKTKVNQAGTSLTTISDAIGGSYLAARQSVATTMEKNAASIQSAQNTYDSAAASLAKTTASPKSYDVTQALATLTLQQIAVDKAKLDLDGATLRAPSTGTVASIANQVGETVGTGSSGFLVLALTSTVALHGTIGEADVAKLRIGQVATVTVDAIGAGARLTGRVTSLDPVATIQQGVPVYGVDVTIDIPDPAVRPGMTGTANVIIASRQSVVTVPNLAIRSANGRRFVQVLRDGRPEDAEVTFGIANESVTEVVSGLAEGDQVVLPAPRAATGQQAPTGPGGFGPGSGGGGGPGGVIIRR